MIATTVMTMGMHGLKRLGLLGRMPPRLLTERLLARLGLRAKTSRRSRRFLTAAGHYGFGSAMGVAFEVTRAALASRRGRPFAPTLLVPAGIAFGELVWVVSYAGWIPAVGLMAPPSADRPGRPTAMVIAHALFGAALGASLRR